MLSSSVQPDNQANTNNSQGAVPVVPQQFTAIFEDKQQYNAKFTHYSFELKKPYRLQFKAGQYISLAVDKQGNRRSYSIINPPSIDHGVELLVEPIAGGLGTTYLQNLQFGDEVNFLAPLGLFTLAEPDPQAVSKEEQLVMIATGSGIAPFRAMIFDQLQEKNDQRSIKLFWGLRHVENLIWQDEFQRLSDHFVNFEFQPVISQPPAEWTLSQGRVTDILSISDFSAKTGFYLCGNPQMIQDAVAILQQKGFPADHIHTEKFESI